MKHLVLLGVVAVCLACSGGTATPAAVSSAPAFPTSCTGTVSSQGIMPPGWVDAAGGHNHPTGIRFTMDRSQTVAGFVFGYPLRAGHPENPANKILWVVRLPRGGSDLTVTAHPLGAATPVVKIVQAANSGPGEIYPTIVDVPAAGCWVLNLAWASHQAVLALPYS
jgi:hypothetical protein